jgi:RHS repeat-associated protein
MMPAIRWLRLTVHLGVSVALIGLLLAETAAPAASAQPPSFTPTPMPSVPGTDYQPGSPPADPTAAMATKSVPAVAWPAAAAAEVDVDQSLRAAPGLPVRLRAMRAPGRVRVQLYDRAAADRAAVDGVLLRLSGASTPVKVELDYSGFRHAYGGDWAGRLRLVRLPECALSTPAAAGCGLEKDEELASSNDLSTAKVTAEVGAAAGSDAVLLALTAGDSSTFGDFRATELAPSGTWSAGGSAGDFAWSYPMRVPPGLGGPIPQVALAYSAQATDGRTAASNSQPSWIAEGFDYWPGFIERSYRQCSDDGQSSTIGDLCWGGDNATLSMSGRGGELVQDTTTPSVWRPRNDDGSKVEKITTGNGDDDGEAWLLTTQDGTRYYFGLNRLPGAPSGTETRSAWTVPVFGDDTNEPCNRSTFAASSCVQAYRWSLDYVVDPQGNTMSIWYDRFTNNYARNRTDTAVSSFVRAGAINHIRYGTRQDPITGVDSAFSASAPMRVDFASTDRCITPGSTCTSSNTANWPDVPWDRNCTSSTNCSGRYSPTFWTSKRLSTVTTRAWGGSAYRDVERWTLNTEFRDPGDGNPKILWLKSLSHAGLTPGYAAASVPDVRFTAVAMTNRVDVNSSTNPIWRFRLSSLVTETGGVISVAYSPAECRVGGTMPSAPESNTRRCFPAYWVKPGATAPTLEYFHRYVVESVTESDPIAGGLPVTSSYRYLDAPAWHFDDNEFIPASKRTYGQWRGYSKVRTITGQAGSVQSQTDTLYFRGMNGDKLPSGTRSVSVVDSLAGSLPDEPWRTGSTREEITYNGVSPSGAAYGTGAPYVNKVLSDPWEHGPTATRTRNGVTVRAYVAKTGRVTVRTALDGGRPDRVTRLSNTFDGPTGRILTVDDEGDVATTADDQCSRYEYADNAAKWMRGYLARTETVSVRCAVQPDRATQVITDTRSWYDGATSFDRQVSKGKITRIEELAGYNGGTPAYVQVSRTSYDEYGRVRDSWDALDRKSSTAYTPAIGGPNTARTITNPLGWSSTSTLEPAWGLPTRLADPNGRVTELAYDALGRSTAVWLPDRDSAAGQSASLTFSYQVRNNAPTAVASSKLNGAGTGYLTSYTLYDGLLRERQTQSPSATGTGRVIGDTIYDYRGMPWKANAPYYNASAPGTTLFDVADASVPSQTVTTYDNAGRSSASILKSYNVEKWRTTTGYGGDRGYTTPPPGGIATTTINDARDQQVELRHHSGGTPSGAFDATRYTWTPAGNLATVTDAAGNLWRYTYDQRGRRVRTEDPDAGTSTATYDAAGQRVAATDARGNTVATTYDALGRKTSVWKGATGSGTKLAEWTYDSLARGQLTSSTRWSDGHAYVSAVTGYDAAYRPTGTATTIPAVEGAVAGTYTTEQSYNADGTVAATTLPAIGGLPKETLTFTYTAAGLPATLGGLTSYLVGSTYDPLGRATQNMLSDGTKTLVKDYVHDPATGRLTRQVVWGETAPQVLADRNYSYDAAGNVTAIADKLAQYGAGSDDNQCFRHDHLRRLTEAWTPANGDCQAAPSTAALGGPAPYWHGFTYDAAGNRRSETRHAAAGDTVRTYAYPAPGSPRPHAVTSVTTTGPGAGTATYGYDASGNTTSRRTATTEQILDWDAEGHLTAVTGGSSYLYDAEGKRLIRRDPNGTTLYLTGQELHASTTGAVRATRYYGAHAVRTSDTGLSWLAPDHQGTSMVAVHAGDMAVTVRRQTPFGGGRGSAPASWPGEQGFVGGTSDASTGLVHLGAREYDPESGRFLSVDPVVDPRDPQQLHAFAYAGNSPVTASDPTGLLREDPGNLPGRPKGFKEGMGPQKNIYPAVVSVQRGRYAVYVKVTDACDYSKGPTACGRKESRLLDFEFLGLPSTAGAGGPPPRPATSAPTTTSTTSTGTRLGARVRGCAWPGT